MHRAVRAVPDEFLLVETDSPDQTPWNRRPGPNEPAFLIDVISTIAAIRDQSPERIARLTRKRRECLEVVLMGHRALNRQWEGGGAGGS